MSMTPAALSAQIKAGIIAELGTPKDATQLQKFCDAVAGVTGQGIVPYVQSAATVPATGTVTTGVGAGGSVVTTGSVQ